MQKIINGRVGKSKLDIKKLRDTLCGMFRRAHASGLIKCNPAEYLETPTGPEGTNRSITEYEREKILSLVDSHPAGLWIKIMLYCGLRPGEIRALDWRHIDFGDKAIHVEVAMKAKTKSIGKPKTASGIRDIPIPDRLLPDLASFRKGPFGPVAVKPLSGIRHDEQSMSHSWRNFKRELDILMGTKMLRGI